MADIQFNEYFNKAVMITKSMFPGVFIYVILAGMTEYFGWDIFVYTAPAIVKNTGFAFVALSVISFPIAREIEKNAPIKAINGDDLLRRLYYASLINLGIAEISVCFGIIIYIMSGDVRYFFLFFNICLLHIIINRPTLSKWENYMDNRFTREP
jgi:hypothetical protein